MNEDNRSLPSGVVLESGEELQMLVRQHWFVFRDSVLIMLFIPFVLLSGIFFLDYTTFPEMVRNVLGTIFLYGSGICFAIGFFMFLWRFYLWKNTVYILTNKRVIIIIQEGLFSHTDRETGLSMIQDVRAKVDGLQATLYGYGNVIMQVSSEDSQLLLSKVGNPREVQRMIIREAHLKKQV